MPLARRWSSKEAWLWRVAWTTAGLGFVGFGLTALRYTKGQYVTVPPSAPLIDKILSDVAVVCVIGGFTLLYEWVVVLHPAKR